ncbi:MAG: dynamin family protein [Akkermansia sp.]|nr:dynamin family protein [Akkermansia sp.]
MAKEFATKEEYARKMELNLESIKETWYYNEFVSKELMDAVNSHLDSLVSFRENLSTKIALYKNGVLTVSIAGVEKAGKTTLLKTLTGIKELPTGKNRCTAVSCEIFYSEKEEEKFEVHYYSQDELVELIKSQVRYILESNISITRNNQELKSDDELSFITLDNLSDLNFPPVTTVKDGLDGKLGSVLKRIDRIKACLQTKECKYKLGKVDTFTDFRSLPQYIAHPCEAGTDDITGESIEANTPVETQPLIRIVKVFKNFEHGVKHLRLYDTPGVSDPDPIATRQMMQAAKSETDMMIVVSKCRGRQTDVTDDLVKLVNILGELKVTDRLFFVVNYAATKEHDSYRDAVEHREKIKKTYTGSNFEVWGPYDASNGKNIETLLTSINERLLTMVEEQDEAFVDIVERDWQNLQNQHAEIVKSLKKLLPDDESYVEAEKYAWYDMWFKMANMSTSSEPQNHFFDKLCYEMSNMTASSGNGDDSLNIVIQDVKNIRAEAWKTIQLWLETNVTDEKCKALLSGRRDNTHEKLLSGLAVEMSEIVNNIARQAEQIGPDVQKYVCDRICRALDVNTFGEKLSMKKISTQFVGNSNDAAEKLSTLCDKLEKGTTDEDVRFVVSKLREIALISERAGYIMRYELRPALNLLDTFRWTKERRHSLDEQVGKIIQSAGNKSEKEQFAYVIAKDAGKESNYSLPKDYDWTQLIESKELIDLLQKIEKVFIGDKMTKEEFEKRYPGLYHGKHCKASPRVLCLRWLFDAMLPSLGNSASEHTKFYYMLAYSSLLTIDSVLSSNEGKLMMLKEDFLAEASQTLCTQLRSENGWKNALRPHCNIILRDKIAPLLEKNKKCADYRKLVEMLDEKR